MANTFTTLTPSGLYDSTLKQVFLDSTANRVASDVGMNLYNVIKQNRKTIQANTFTGAHGISSAPESSDYALAQTYDSDSVTATQKKRASVLSVSKEARDFIAVDPATGVVDFTNIEDLVRNFTDIAYDAIDQDMADALLGGFSTSYVNPYGETVLSETVDSHQLFYATHTLQDSTAYSNIITDGSVSNPLLTRGALVETIARGRRFRSVGNVARPVKYDTLLVGPGNEDQARRLVESAKIAGSANNDTNGSISSLKVKVWDRLDATSAGTDTSGYWFMYDSSNVKRALQFHSYHLPKLYPPETSERNNDWSYKMDYYSVIMNVEPWHIAGSKGTQAA